MPSTRRNETLSPDDSAPVTVSLPASRFVMIGNPFTQEAVVMDADLVYTYDPSSGYQQTDRLHAGQGAWSFSASGGVATLVPQPTSVPP